MRTGPPHDRARLGPVALLLTLATLVLYLPVLRFDFVNYDDQDYVTDNGEVKNGLTWQGLRWAFTTFHAANWHPLTWLSHMLDCQLFGLNPGAHHFINVLFHSVNAALLLVLLVRMTGLLWPALMVAALFAWHPLHVESVAWISERKDVLSTFFGLLSLLSYVQFVKTRSRAGYALALLYFALSLLAKPMLVTLPFLMLLLDFWPLQRFSLSAPTFMRHCLRLGAEKTPFILLAAGSCVMTCLAQRYAMMTTDLLPFGSRLENVLLSYVRYLLKMIWPVDLAILYPLSQPFQWIHAAAAASALLLFFLSWLAWRERNRRPYVTIGWLWFLGTLVPVIGLVKVGNMALADRYTYFPLIGIFIAVAFSAHELAAHFSSLKKPFLVTAIVILSACMALTERQLQFWHDSESLFRHNIAVTPDNSDAHVNLGAALETTGHPAEAMDEFRAAIRAAPKNPTAHINLANMLLAAGRTAEALPEYHNAISLDPDNGRFHYDLGFALVNLGQFDTATNELAFAVRYDPNNPWPNYELAIALMKTGHDPEAIDALRAALRIDPDNYQILVLAAHVLAADENAALRNGREALTYAIKANLLTGGSQPMVLDVLGMACAEAGLFADACDSGQKAIDLAASAKMPDLEPLRQRLELYKKQQPWRESFRATNAPVDPAKN